MARLNKIIFTLILVSMLLSAPQCVSSQRVYRPTILDEILPTSYVTDVERDAQGFIWISTANGLCRYDGSSIQTFRHNPSDTNSLPHNHISEMIFDQNRNGLWLGTEKGLSLFSMDEYQFSRMPLGSQNSDESKDGVGALCLLENGDLWFSIEETGIGLYAAADESITVYPFQEEVPGPMQSKILKQVLDVQRDLLDRNLLWLGTAGGLVRFDIESGTFFPFYFTDPNLELQGHYNQIRYVLPMENGPLWIGTWSQGLIRFSPDRKSDSPTFVQPDQFEKFYENGTVPPLFLIDSNTAYYNSLSSCVIDLKSGDLTDCISMKNQLGKQYGIQINLVDDKGRKWATSEYGLQIFDPISEQIENYQFESNDAFFYIDGTFLENREGDVIITYEHGEGAYIYDHATGLIQTAFPSTDRFVTEGAFKGQGIIMRPDGEIWLAELHKIYRFDSRNSQLIPLDLPVDKIPHLWTSILQDRSGGIWLGTRNSGLVYFKPGTGSIQVFKTEMESQETGPAAWIEHLHEDRNGNIWISKERGYSVYLKETKRFLHFDQFPEKNFQLTNFIEDPKGNIWSAVRDVGLIRMNADSIERGIIQIIDVSNGLDVDGIISISFDSESSIWMITDFGLQKYDPVTGSSEMFGTSDGMITFDPRFNRNPSVLTSIGLLSNGRMAYAPRAGFSTFYPKEMKKNSEVPRPYLREISVGDSVIATDLFAPINDMSFSYHQNDMELECSAIAFSQSNHLTFEYRLGESEWKPMKNRRIQFSSLSPDDYKFDFRVKNSDGLYSEHLSMKFEIRQPWWLSWWFLILSSVILAASIWSISQYRARKREAVQKKEQEVQLMLAQLESRVLRNQMNPHFLFNIFNNIQELILTGDTEKAYTYTTKFSKLLRTILVDARKDEITIEQECEFLQLYLDLESLRFDGAFNYEMIVEDGLGMMHIPVFVIQPLVENAIRHGLLPQEGEKQLEIRFFSDDENIKCTVMDNGVGLNNKSKSTKPKDRDHALQLIANRLRILNGATLDLQDRKDGTGAIALVSIPMNRLNGMPKR